jgi:hypothetical protein
MPIYAQVDMSKKRSKRQQDDMPIYAQVDKSKKKVGGGRRNGKFIHRRRCSCLSRSLLSERQQNMSTFGKEKTIYPGKKTLKIGNS